MATSLRSTATVLGSIAFALVVGETALRLVHQVEDPYREYKQGASLPLNGSPYVPRAVPANTRITVEPEPGLPGVDTVPHVASFNEYGMRGGNIVSPKPAGEYRVFIVGASTTECLLLKDDETLPARLEARLGALMNKRVKVYAAARSGDRSFDHVSIVAHRLVHLEPDVVVVFAGINDLGAAIQGRDYLLRDIASPIGLRRLILLAATEFQIPRLIRRAWKGPVQQPILYREAVRVYGGLPLSGEAPRTDITPYRQNLASIAGMVTAQGAKVVFMTQATSWTTSDAELRKWHWMTGKTTRYREPALDSALELYNDAMRSLGDEQRGVSVFDFSRAVGPTRDIFYDDVHFNAKGADSAAALLSSFLAGRH